MTDESTPIVVFIWVDICIKTSHLQSASLGKKTRRNWCKIYITIHTQQTYAGLDQYLTWGLETFVPLPPILQYNITNFSIPVTIVKPQINQCFATNLKCKISGIRCKVSFMQRNTIKPIRKQYKWFMTELKKIQINLRRNCNPFRK